MALVVVLHLVPSFRNKHVAKLQNNFRTIDELNRSPLVILPIMLPMCGANSIREMFTSFMTNFYDSIINHVLMMLMIRVLATTRLITKCFKELSAGLFECGHNNVCNRQLRLNLLIVLTIIYIILIFSAFPSKNRSIHYFVWIKATLGCSWTKLITLMTSIFTWKVKGQCAFIWPLSLLNIDDIAFSWKTFSL